MFCNSRKLDFKDAHDPSSDSTIREISDTEARAYIRVSQDVEKWHETTRLVPALAKKLKVTKMNSVKPIT